MKRRSLGVIFAIVCLLSADLVLSLAGREAFILRYVPFLSFQMAAALAIGICVACSYVLWRLLRARQQFFLLVFGAAAALLMVTCFFGYEVLSKKSSEEARELAHDFLAHSRKYKVSYGEHTDERQIVAAREAGAVLNPTYVSHAYGRYAYRLHAEGRDDLIVQLNKDFAEASFFVYRPDSYSGPRN